MDAEMEPADLVVVRGDPTPEELAAVLVVLLAAATNHAPPVHDARPGSPRPAWSAGGWTAHWHGPAAWSPAAEPWRPAA